MNPRADLAADMMHNNLASHVETVQNAVHSSVDIAAWISNNSVTQINTPVKANIDLLGRPVLTKESRASDAMML